MPVKHTCRQYVCWVRTFEFLQTPQYKNYNIRMKCSNICYVYVKKSHGKVYKSVLPPRSDRQMMYELACTMHIGSHNIGMIPLFLCVIVVL